MSNKIKGVIHNQKAIQVSVTSGIKGDKGDRGERGVAGKDGKDGLDGIDGKQGLQGERGLQGEQGLTGEKGDTGINGVDGLDGKQGKDGIQGEKGEGFDYSTMSPEEIASIKGEQGKQGEKGDRGERGEQGIQGIQGIAGKDGIDGGGSGGSGFPVEAVTNVTLVSVGDGEVAFTWDDPDDVVIDGITYAQWKSTRVMRKIGSYPVNEDDGELVVSSGVRNQYSVTPYFDTGLTNNQDYYYSLFSVTADGVVAFSEGARVAGTPSFGDDLTDAPGGKVLINGDMEAGFFGIVPSSEFVTRSELTTLLGVTPGTTISNNVDWLKFAYKNKILFIAQKSVSHTIPHSTLDYQGLSSGRPVSKDGVDYLCRLITSDGVDSEWNKLMLPLHMKAKDQSWMFPANVTTPTEYWGMDFTDEDFGIGSNRDGRSRWTKDNRMKWRIVRGGDECPSEIMEFDADVRTRETGWCPVLEVVGSDLL